MPFQTPINPVTGIRLPANISNIWGDNNRWLHAQATKTWDVFTGWEYSSNSTLAADTDLTAWQGWFVYQGVKTLEGLATRAAGKMRIYVDHDGGTATVHDARSSPSFPIDLSAYTFTSGNRYKVKVAYVRESAFADSDAGGTGTYLAVPVSNAFAWPTLAAWTDATAPTAAHFATITTAQKYANALVPIYGSSVCVACYVQGVSTVIMRGAFYVRKLGAAMQTSLTINYRFGDGTATLRVYDSGGTLRDTFTLTSDGTERTETKTLTAASYTANTIARWTVETSAGGGDGNNYLHWVKQLTVGGTVALSHAVPTFAHLDVVKGTTSAQQLYYLGNENLSDIRTLLRGSGSDQQLQFLTPDQSLGKVLRDNTSLTGYQFGRAGDDAGDNACKRRHTFRYLYYLPTASGASGELRYGKQNVGLPDNAAGGWNYYDLYSMPDLPLGMNIIVNGVKACYSSQ